MGSNPKPKKEGKIVCKILRDGLTTAQIDRLLDIASTSYSKENPIWRHLNITYAESKDFFRGYLLNSEYICVAIDTADNDRLVGAFLATTLDLQDTQSVTNWRSTPASVPYIELLKHIFSTMDKSKIPEGKVAFGKSMFVDREYTGVFGPLM